MKGALVTLRLYVRLLGGIRGPLVLMAKQMGAGSPPGRMLQRVADNIGALRTWGFRDSRRMGASCRRQCERILVPGLSRPVSLRRNGTDHRAFEHIFLHAAYDVCLPCDSVSVVVDGGANIGLATVYFAKRYPAARIVSVEPDGENFGQLMMNCGGYANIQLVQAALWGMSERVRIDNPEAASWSFRVATDSRPTGNSLQGYTVKKLMQLHGLSHVDILKLDIEGAEGEVFQSCCDEWLGTVRMIICELHERYSPGCSELFHNAMRRHGFRVIYCGENAIAIKTPPGRFQ